MTAAANRERYRKIANRARRIPGQHGLRPWRVYIETGTWSSTSGHPFGEGTRTDTSTEILEQGYPPRVRELSDEQIALGAGSKGDKRIGPITPVVGTPWATLLSSAATSGDSIWVRLVHDETGETIRCAATASQMDRALRFVLTTRMMRTDG